MSFSRDSRIRPSPLPAEATLDAASRRVFSDASSFVVTSAYLFGSVPEGRAHRESDIDVGVLLDWQSHRSRAERFDAGLRLAGSLQGQLGRSVDLVVLNDAPPLFGRHVVTRGRRIFCSDALRDREYVRDVQLRAADLEPWLRRFRSLKLEAIRRPAGME